MTEIICIMLTCISVIITAAAQIEKYKQRKCIKQAVEDIHHFLLYPETVAEETLQEGPIYNLMNQVLKLEAQFLFEKNTFKKKETQVNCFIENMVHQIKTSITALQIRLDLALFQCDNSKEMETLKKSQECLSRLTNEVERILTSSQLAAGKVMMVYEELNIENLLSGCVERLRVLAKKKKCRIKTGRTY